MQETRTLENDLYLYHCGEEACAPAHRWRSVRDYYLFHYVISGKGEAFFGSEAHSIQEGEGFLHVPGELSDYQADSKDPWHYLWIAFKGQKAAKYLEGIGLGPGRRIYRSTDPKKTSQRLLHLIKQLAFEPPFFEKTALLYRVFAVLDAFRNETEAFSPDNHIAGDYLEALHEWIRDKYQDPQASVQGMAERMGLSRTYLSTLVKKRSGKTPQELLLGFRMYKARELLISGNQAVASIARAVGYEDPLSFSRSFKRWFSFSPRELRRRGAKDDNP